MPVGNNTYNVMEIVSRKTSSYQIIDYCSMHIHSGSGSWFPTGQRLSVKASVLSTLLHQLILKTS